MNADANLLGERLLSQLAMSPDIYPQKIDFAANSVLLIEFDAATYRSSSFLDDRILSPTTRGAWVTIDRILNATGEIRNRRPLHFIFHTGHVGSTLVSRLLDEIPGVWSLREPLPLRTLADQFDVLDLPEALLHRERFNSVLKVFLRLWSRGYESTHTIILKATSSAARIAEPILAQSASRAVYLNVAAEPYLATLLAGQNSPLDLRGHGSGRIRRLQARLATKASPLHSLSLGELAAMSWLVESWTQWDVVQNFRERVLSLDFDRFLADVPAAMNRIVQHLALPADARHLSELTRSPVLTRYSKATEYEYSPAVRAQILAESRSRNRDELVKGMRWLEAMARANTDVAKILNVRYD